MKRARPILVLALIVSSAVPSARADELTLTTSYPSPVGVYNQLITTGGSKAQKLPTTLARNAGNVILAPSPTNDAGRVGIGTDAPAAKLDVNGAVRIGASSHGCSGANEGSLRWNSAAKRLEVCDGQAWAAAGGGLQVVGRFSFAISANGRSASASPVLPQRAQALVTVYANTCVSNKAQATVELRVNGVRRDVIYQSDSASSGSDTCGVQALTYRGPLPAGRQSLLVVISPRTLRGYFPSYQGYSPPQNDVKGYIFYPLAPAD